MGNINMFKPIPSKDHAFIMAKHFPTGKAWSAVFNDDSNIGKLISGLSKELYRMESITQTIADEMNLNKVSQMLSDWEISCGIPDDCLRIDDPRIARNLQVKGKFANFGGIQIKTDYVRLAADFGFDIDVYAGAEYWLLNSVQSMTRSSGTVTVTTVNDHLYQTGMAIEIDGANESEYNGLQSITVTGAKTFTFTIGTTPTTPATGTITADLPAKLKKHTIVCTLTSSLIGEYFFPLPFPYEFKFGGTDFLQCLFETVAPANVEVYIL
jgi:uncharacterized protein YmfQ (DUF2313 family)